MATQTQAPRGATSPPRAVAYLRRSTDRQEQSLDDQRRAIETYAEEEGFEIIEWFIDDAISGTSTQARKGFQAMVQTAQDPSSSFRHVLVYDVKRFGRVDTDEAGYYRHLLRRAQVEIIYVSEGFNGDDSDDLIRSVKQWQARNESKDLSKVTIRGQVSHTENGFWCGGTPPFGYDLQYADANGKPYQIIRWLANGDKEVYNPKGKLVRRLQRGERLTSSKKDHVRLILSTAERIALIRRIFRESVEEGKGYRTIANQLNHEGIPSPRDGNWSKNTRSRWSVGTIRAILRNPTYTGDSVWNRRTFAKFHRIQAGVAVPRDRQVADKPRENTDADWIIVPNTHEPVISRAIFHRAQELMKLRGRNSGFKSFRRGSGTRSPYLLSGLITCGRCGHRYQGRVTNSAKRRQDGSKIRTLYYACGGYVMKGTSTCGKFLLQRAPLERFVEGLVADKIQALIRGEGIDILEERLAGGEAGPATEPGGKRHVFERALYRSRRRPVYC